MFSVFLFLVIFVSLMLFVDAERNFQVQGDGLGSHVAVSNVFEENMAFFIDFISEELVVKAQEGERVVIAETPREESNSHSTVIEALEQQTISTDAIALTNSDEVKPVKETKKRKPRTKKETVADGTLVKTKSRKTRTKEQVQSVA